MQYDFTKVQRIIEANGKTLKDVQSITDVPFTTAGRALKTGRASQNTALKIVKGFRSEGFDLSMEDLLVTPSRRKSA